jgi:putative FmdB family regulatory protein
MPFYEYECPHCRRHSEVLQKISAKPLTKCPECGKSGLRKLISAPVFRLKGSGWYETDFKSDKEGKRNLAGGDDAPAAKEEGKAEAKTETKAETKSETKSESKSEAKSSASKTRAKPAAGKAPARKPKPAARPAARASGRSSARKGARR